MSIRNRIADHRFRSLIFKVTIEVSLHIADQESKYWHHEVRDG